MDKHRVKTAADNRHVNSASNFPGRFLFFFGRALRIDAWLLTLAALLCALPPAMALDPARMLTQYQTKHWGPEDGLPCNNVLAVTQAADGYLWLGTEEGLVRFDGVRARFFERESGPLAGTNNISAVLEDARCPGCLVLLGSSGNVRRFADGQMQAATLNTAPTHQPGQILVQNPVDGALWIGTVHGLFRVSPTGEVTAPMAASSDWPAEPVNTLCRDGAGRLWVGGAQGIYRQRDPGDGRHFDLLPGWQGGEVDCVAPARGGGLWIGSRAGGIGRLGEDNVFHPRAALAGCVVTALFEDSHGMLWAGTFGSGLCRFPVSGAAGSAATALTTANGLIDNVINGFCEDREGNLWIATERGLQALRDTRFVNYGRAEGLAGDDADTIYEDQRSQIWIGSTNGLSRLSAARDVVTKYATPPSPRRPGDDLVLCLGPGDDADTLLAGTHAGLLRWRDGQLEPLPLRDDLDGSIVRALCVDAAGDRWIGASSGLYQERAGKIIARLTTADGLADNLIRAIYADPANNLWVATDGGLSRRGADGRITNFLTADVGSVLCLAREPSGAGDLFAGTEFGLHRLHTLADGTVRVTSYTTREGLFDNTMWCLLDDGCGNLWTSSNKGIARVAWADLDRFDRKKTDSVPHVAYDAQDGLRSREGNGGHQPVAWRDRAGALWFAMVKGAACVDPATALGSNPAPPPARVEELTADGKVVPLDFGRSPVLPAGTQKFELRYTALNLTAPERSRFRYRLEPFDTQWTDAGAERVAHYTNLPPGSYRFLVRSANGGGAWNEAGATLAFTLRPHFYQMIWVRLLAAALVLGLGWVWLRSHKRHLVARIVQAEADVRERIRHQDILNAAKDEAERAQEEAERARAEAEQASNAKSEFLSRVSHELRTPLNAILGFGQLLELDDLTPGQSLSVGHILLGGRHLLGLVNEVLDLASIESGKMELDLDEIEVGPLLRETVDLVGPLARARSVRVHLDSTTETIFVRADRRRLKQVVLNLVDNAVKYNRPTGGEVFVDARADLAVTGGEAVPGSLRLQVRDTGAGINAADLKRICTPFERLSAAHGPIKGTGLGLAVSKQLVEAMGGQLGVESEPGRGSTFWIELPLASPAARPTAKASLNDTPDPSPGEPPVATMLYIEDNLSNLQVVNALVTSQRPNWHFASALEGGAGLEQAVRILPDLILLDLQLPGMSGEEVLISLRREPATRHIPVIVLSADATTRSRERLLASGANDYLTKPFELDNLLEVADQMLSKTVGRPQLDCV